MINILLYWFFVLSGFVILNWEKKSFEFFTIILKRNLILKFYNSFFKILYEDTVKSFNIKYPFQKTFIVVQIIIRIKLLYLK